MAAVDHLRIPLTQLSRTCNCDEELAFCRTSLDVPRLEGVIGQDRAVRSMQFGLDMTAPGYNIFVVGAPGTGKSTYVQAIVNHVAAQGTVPDDWCYIHNFADKDNPLTVSLPAGQGRIFQTDMQELLADLRVAIPKSFESSDFEQQKDTILQELQSQMQSAFQGLEEEAKAGGFLLKQAPGKFVFVPIRDDKPLSNEEFEQLTSLEQRTFQESGRKLEKRLEETLHTGRALEKSAKEKITELEKQITLAAAKPYIDRLKEKYAAYAKLSAYLEALLADIESSHELFKGAGQPAAPPQLSFMAPQQDDEDAFVRYKVNLFVNNEKTQGAPVIVEPFLYYYNLFGKVEYQSHLMALSTNFTMAKSGAIHRANGGYLILQAKDVLTEPFVWETLKRAIKYRSAVVENIGEQYRYIPTVTMRMEPIPLDLKVILIGSPVLFYILSQDEDFQKLFKVKVEFDIEMQRSGDNLCKYASFISSICQNDQLLPFSQTGLARVVEYGSRLAGSQDKLSTRFNEVSEIVYEAHALARSAQAAYVEAAHVDLAIRERKYRNNRIEEKIQEMIFKGKIMIDTSGAVVGQINGLSVISLGGFLFGQPSRITAVTYIGRGGIINIERETDMSGQIHSKGVLTMAGYLGAQFAQDYPLSLTAQITFEQNYAGVDGDSASCAELYAILSSLADLPIKQSLAVTGSVNQLGSVQPIGGVTEKVEGFFDVCHAQGLTGEQGVIIPIQNVDNLMLKTEVIEAVRDGRFHLYAVRTVAEGIELLTGVPAGSRGEDGAYPEGTVFDRVRRKLGRYQEKLALANRRAMADKADNKDSAGAIISE
jgi:lon-related putative ATP-dependent protease